MADDKSKQSNGKRDADSETERAEEKLEDLGRRIGRFVARVGARTREEAEDIWAEAQSLRRGERR